MDDSVREEIAKLAYKLWEKDGKAEGRDKEHWRQAEMMVAARLEEGSQMLSEEGPDACAAEEERACG